MFLTVAGWLTIGPNLTSSNFQKDLYLSFFEAADEYLLGQSDNIESLRPKTPPLKGRGGGRGQGTGRGGLAGGIGRGASVMQRVGMHGPGKGY